VTQGSGPSPSYAFSNGTTSNTNHIISGVSYDDAGNMTYDGSYYYTYDGNNRVVGVGTSSGSNNVASYSYNSRGMRVSTTSSGGTVEWMFDLSGNALTASVPGTTQFYGAEYFVGGRDWGTLSTGGVNFRYPDWVGNGRVWQDVAGTVTQQAAYAAFGDGLFAPGGGSCCSLQAGMFDDAWQDSANNTYHTLNREYSPTQGRWLTPDPAGMAAIDPTNPQTWNRYAYVTNNPVSFTDPLGLEVEGGGSGTSGGEDVGGPGGLGDGGACAGFTDGAGSSGMTCGDFTFFLPTIPAISAISGPNPSPGGGTIGNQYTDPNPSGDGTADSPYVFYTDVWWPYLIAPASQWVLSSRGLFGWKLPWPFWHWYFYNTATGTSVGLGPSGWETSEEGPGHIEWIPTDAQSQCINSQLNSRGEPPDYYWLQFRSNTPATNCRGYCMRVIHSCGIY
jgi:RHS repeat-associated protein